MTKECLRDIVVLMNQDSPKDNIIHIIKGRILMILYIHFQTVILVHKESPFKDTFF